MSTRALLREDGSVVIPPAAAGLLLGLLDRELRAAGARNGGARLSADVLAVAHALALSDAGTWPVPAGRELLTTGQYAQRRGISERHVRRLCRSGDLSALRVGLTWAVLAQVDEKGEVSHGLSDVRATAAAG